MKNKDTYLLDLYLEELDNIEPITAEEEKSLLDSLHTDEGSRKRLIEGNLKSSLMILKDYTGTGINMEDIVGELNLALINAIDTYESGDFREHINKYINKYMQEFIENERQERENTKDLSERMNIMSETASILAKKYNREATVEEIAKAMNMELDKVRAMMKMTMDTVS